MSDHLLDILLDAGFKAVAVIGMAKNAGKTTVLNHLLSEICRREMKIAAASIGRDGEDYDAVTLKKKPRVMLPPGSVFITTDRLVRRQVSAGKLDARVLADLKLETVLGRVYIYQTENGGEAELAGLNRISGMLDVKNRLIEKTDLFLIDGALDRRSSAVPALADGIILTTGAVVGRDMESVVRATKETTAILTLPAMEPGADRDMAAETLNKGLTVRINRGNSIPLTYDGIPLAPVLLKETPLESGDVLVFNGAFTENLAEALIYRRDLPACTLVVRDGTRVFTTFRSLRLLYSRDIQLRVMNPMRIAAVTANPHNPLGHDLDKLELVDRLQKELHPLPVRDVENYQDRARNDA